MKTVLILASLLMASSASAQNDSRYQQLLDAYKNSNLEIKFKDVSNQMIRGRCFDQSKPNKEIDVGLYGDTYRKLFKTEKRFSVVEIDGHGTVSDERLREGHGEMVKEIRELFPVTHETRSRLLTYVYLTYHVGTLKKISNNEYVMVVYDMEQILEANDKLPSLSKTAKLLREDEIKISCYFKKK